MMGHYVSVGGLDIQFRVAVFGQDVDGRLKIVQSLRAMNALVGSGVRSEDPKVRETAKEARLAVDLLLAVFLAISEQVAENEASAASAAAAAEATNG